jgi:hypothetical protein
MSEPAATYTADPHCVICKCTEENACIEKARDDGMRPCRWLREPREGVGLCSAKTCRPFLKAWDKAVRMAKQPEVQFLDALKATIEATK